jgi:hypothetical protein
MQTVYVGNTLINDVMLGAQRMDDVLQNILFVPTDQAAINFINATGITDNTIKEAINTLVVDLKANNLWNKLYVLYPFVGGTTDTNKYNLVNTGSYTISFNGPWTYNNNGITGNGTSTYANTGYSVSVSTWYSSGSLFNYSRTTGKSGYDMGVNDVATGEYYLSNRLTNDFTYLTLQASPTTVASTDGSGLFMGNSRTSTQTAYRNGSQILVATKTAVNNPTIPFYLGANNFQNTSVGDYTNRNYALGGFGQSFNGTEASTFYTIVQNFQTSLNRQV